MYDRIITAFNKNINTEERGAIWEWCHEHATQVTMTKENLDNMANTLLVWGFFGGTDPNFNKDSLIKLAMGVGAIGIYDPEGGGKLLPRVHAGMFNNSELLNMTEEKIGFKINLPPFVGGRDILSTSHGVLTERHCHYLWVMKRIVELCPDRDSKILEIGAGIGLLGYFLDKAGYKNYTTIDLAQAGACQAYFLHKNLPERDFCLSGENGTIHRAIRLLHANDLDSISNEKFDIMVNMDGLTEMPRETAVKYVNSKLAPLFLSINHEVNNFRINEIASNRVYRYPFWVRDGYVEELYKI